MPKSRAHKTVLNMLAVQIAGKFPGDRSDGEYVLQRVRELLNTFVYEEKDDSKAPSTTPSLKLVRGDGD